MTSDAAAWWHLSTRARPPRRRVQLKGRAFADERGMFPAVGATLMWGGWGMSFDRSRVERNLDWLVGFDWVRVLCMVGQPDNAGFWAGRTNDPGRSSYFTDFDWLLGAAAERGLRVQPVICADAQFMMPRQASRRSFAREVAQFCEDRAEAIQFVEAWNELAGNGGTDAACRELVDVMRDATTIPVAASDPYAYRSHTCSVAQELYRNLDVDLATFHFDRDTSKVDGRWRHVRQPWEVRDCEGMPPAFVSNEPIGPRSSVAQDDDPTRIVCAAITTYIAGGAGYVYHCRAGVRGDEDLSQERNADAIKSGLLAMRAYLPPDLANWRRQNHYWSTHPYHPGFQNGQQIWPDGGFSGVVRCYAATKDDSPQPRLVMLPCGIRDHVSLVPVDDSADTSVRDVMTGETLRVTRGRFVLQERGEAGRTAFLVTRGIGDS